MLGIDDAIGGVSKLFDDAINKIWPDPAAKASAEAVTIKATADAAIAQLQSQLSIMLEEAKSADPWTSRARPSFLYVIYVLLLASLPMGALYAVSPEAAGRVAEGFRAWLGAIPPEMWTTFQTGYLGYVVAKSSEAHGGILPMITGKRK